MKKLLLIHIFCFVTCSFCFGQKYNRLQADFSILEKNTLKDSSYIVIGKIDYDLFTDISKYQITFPQKTTWIFQDSTITTYDSLMVIQRIDTIGAKFNEFTIFRNILMDKMNDFGLVEAGFSIDQIEKVEESTIYQWKPPDGQFEFINYIVTEQQDEKLKGLIIVDQDDKSINKTYYEDYINIQELSIPQQIKLHFIADQEEIFKVINFRDVQIF